MNNSKIEKELTEKINYLFEKFDEKLSNKYIKYEIKLKKSDEVYSKEYTSEIEIDLYFKNNLFDIIEFFIFRNGVLKIDVNLIIDELSQDIETIIKRY